MRAAVYQAPGQVVVEDVPDASLSSPSDAVVGSFAPACAAQTSGPTGVSSSAPAGARLGP